MTLYILYSGSKFIDSNFVYLTGCSNLDEISVLFNGKKYSIDQIDILKYNKVYTLSNYVENKYLNRLFNDKKIKIIDKYIEKSRRVKNSR